jgi:uncharacterized protein YjiS (DUF1127 family)
MIMSAIAPCRRRLGSAAAPSTTVAESWIGRVAARAIGLIAAFVARRAERRLLRELDKLDDRLLDDIGIDRGMLGRPLRPGERAEQELLRRHLH